MQNQSLDETIQHMQRYIERDVAAGFADVEEIVGGAVDVFSDEQDPELLRPVAERLTREALATHLKAQTSWPAVTDCDRLDAAFTELERNGIISRQHFSCCGTCGAGEILDEMQDASQAGLAVRGYTFYHVQDTESAVEAGTLYLAYGSVDEGEAAALAVAREVTQALRQHGLAVEWNGQWAKRVEVALNWKRRRSAESSV